MSGVFSGGGGGSRPKPPDRSAEEATEKADALRRRRRLARGRQDTVLTSGLGAFQGDDALMTATLLGA